MRKLAYVVSIGSKESIPNSDYLEVAIPNGHGWRVVVQKNEFNVGDLCIMFEIDSFLPADDPRYAFLRDRCLKKFVSKSGNVLREGIRIKTIKLRGQVSQGLLMPIDNFIGPERELALMAGPVSPKDVISEDGSTVRESDIEGMENCEIIYWDTDENGDPKKVEVVPGFDLTAILHVEHYDEVKDSLSALTGSNPISADAMGRFPSDYCPKTDEERIQNLGDWFEKYKDMDWEVTAKDDGSSLTMFYSPTIDSENPFGVCTRNLRIKPELAKGGIPLGYQMAVKYKVEEILKAYYDATKIELAVQGELVGPGVNADRDKYQEHEWHVFKIYDITNQKYLLPFERRLRCEEFGFTHVQVINPNIKVFTEYPTMDAVLKFAEGKTLRGNEREGVVFKSNTVHNLSFKAVSNRYLLKQED